MKVDAAETIANRQYSFGSSGSLALGAKAAQEIIDHLIESGFKIEAPDVDLGPVKIDYTREELVAICEAATTPESRWRDRDSASAHGKLGEAWALLRCGCDFEVHGPDYGAERNSAMITTHETIWLTIWSKGFRYFEMFDEDYPAGSHAGMDEETFYLPTPSRISDAAGGDWY